MSSKNEFLLAFVAYLERRHRLDGDDAVRPQIDSLRRVAEKHRQPAGEDEKDLLLSVISVPPSACAWRIAPEAST